MGRTLIELRTRVVTLPMRFVHTIAHGSYSERENLFVELRAGAHRGYGESCAVTYYGVDAPAMQAKIEGARATIEAWDGEDPDAFWTTMFEALDGDRFALCALDEAAWDLWGKRRDTPLWQAWGLSTADAPHSDYTIAIDDIDTMLAKLRAFPRFPIYKIKLGTDRDVEIVEALRRATDATFRVDANCGWTVEQTLEMSRALRALGVEFIEQPLPAADREGMARVFAESALPIVADESCMVEADVDACHGLFHGVNIKLTKAGGITPARRMIHRARALDMRVMVGCMAESTVGISAIGQLAPLLDWVDMDGALLIAEDVAEGVHVVDGTIHYPQRAGTGAQWAGPAWR